MRNRGEGDIFALMFVGVVGLVVYGGYSLWEKHFADPPPADDHCFWLAVKMGHESASFYCLVERPPPNAVGCVQQLPVTMNQFACRTSLDAALEISSKAGRRICGDSRFICD